MPDRSMQSAGLRGACFVALLAAALPAPAVAQDAVRFNRDIRPILSGQCFQCHGPDQAQRKADLRLDVEAGAKDAAIVPGQLEESELYRRITSTDPDEQMPPPDSGKKLTPAQIEQIARHRLAIREASGRTID